MKATYQLNQEKLEYNFQVSQLTCTYTSKFPKLLYRALDIIKANANTLVCLQPLV